MKMRFKKIVALLLVCILAIPACASAFAASDEGYFAFVAFGGDAAAENDWGFQYYGDGAGSNAGDVVGTSAYIKEGETVTIGVEFPSAVVNAWFFAPCIVAADGSINAGNNAIDATVKCFIDGVEVAIDTAADAEGKLSWVEGTGDYSENCHRLYGGFNEWATKYIEEPAGFTKLEYEITLNSVVAPLPEGVSEIVAYEDAVDLFIAFGGDAAAENDWGFQYYGDGAGSNAGEITATNATIKAGETATISLNFAAPVFNAWFFAPCVVGEGIGAGLTNVEADIVCKIDGQEVAIDFTQGDFFWSEGTGDYVGENCIRLAGGFNEWAAKYIEEPAGFTSLEYTITLNKMEMAVVEEVAPFDVESALAENYNAYIGVQSENWIFRNQYYDASYGRDVDVTNDAGNHVFSNLAYIEADGTVVSKGGSFSDCLIDGDGTYTVSIDLSDAPDVFANDTFYNQIFVATELPYGLIAEGAVTISDVTTSFDGQPGKEYTNVVEVEGAGTTDIVIFNTWTVGNETIPFTMATDRIDITFTVSGFGRESSFVAPSVEEEPAVEEEPVVDEEPVVEEDKGGADMTTIIVIAAAAVVLAAAIVGICVSVAKKNKSKKEEAAE